MTAQMGAQKLVSNARHCHAPNESDHTPFATLWRVKGYYAIGVSLGLANANMCRSRESPRTIHPITCGRKRKARQRDSNLRGQVEKSNES